MADTQKWSSKGPMLPAERRRRILERLAQRGRVTVAELSRELHVSPMTVHRDLNTLAARGMLRKVRGGAVPATVHDPHDCPMCAHMPDGRTGMTLHLRGGETWRTCCAHCGLWSLTIHGEEIVAAVVPDFLTGRTVNAHQATYLVGPDVELCCVPTVLAFESPRDAARFQQGFGGQVATWEQAVQAIQTHMEKKSS
ncbi:MAG: DeoR family transcriptional regulator [Ardenticatenia bacterium]|nr:DeoR family transcriptional regulator [Ardenticatenia bacterium]